MKRTLTIDVPVPADQEVPARKAYTPDQAAVLLGIGRSKIYELLKAKKIRAVKIGDLTRITGAELDRFLAEECPEAYPDAV